MAEDLGELVERKYNGMLKTGGRKAWRGMLQVGASGFGKGLLITAAVILATTAAIFGFGASLGEITIGPATATVGQGIAIGLGKAFQFLTSWGFAVPAAAGVVSAFADISREQGRVSAAQAKQLEKEYELRRQQATEINPLSSAPAKPRANDIAQNKWRAGELDRRANNKTAGGIAYG